MAISGDTIDDFGQVLTQHPITNGLTAPYVAMNGYLNVPPEAVKLINGPLDSLVAAVIDHSPDLGSGRLFVLGDKDMLTNVMMFYTDNATLNKNIAAWALHQPMEITGHVELALFVGDPAGVPLEVRLYDQSGVVETIDTTLDSAGNYSVYPTLSGPYTVYAKPHHCLSKRQADVAVGPATVVDWTMDYNGDANNDNKVNLLDLSMVLADFGMTGPDDADMNGDGRVGLMDLSLVLSNYNLSGE